MKSSSNSTNWQSQLIHLQHNEWVERQRVIGKRLADIMGILQRLVFDKTKLTLLELDKIVENEITTSGFAPTFLQYKGFPNTCCISINRTLVHGVSTSYVLQEGDVVSFDFGITDDVGVIVDSANTMIFGEPKSQDHVRLIDTTKKCLYNAIRSIAVGRQLGVIGNAIFKTAKNAGFNVIDKFGGHGITINQVHAAPFISNKSLPNEGIVIQPGLSLAIEPLLVPYGCSTNTSLGSDGWTVNTEDIGAHEEHSLFIHSDCVEIMTLRPEEEKDMPRKVYFGDR